MISPQTKILIIDDMKAVRDMSKKYLTALGFSNLEEAENGEDGLNKLKRAQMAGEAFGLVISDWNMPKMSGIELLRKVREVAAWKTLPFLLVTTESEKSKILEAVTLGVTSYIIKPFSLESFRAKLEKIQVL